MHQRILVNYLNSLLDEELAEVWEITVGLLSHDLGARFWQKTLTMVRDGEEFKAALQTPAILKSLLKTGQTQRLAHLCPTLVEEDKLVFHKLKEVLCRGVRVFETYVEFTIEKGKEELISSIMQILVVVQQYYDLLAEMIKQSESAYALPIFDSDELQITPPYTGHGSNLEILTPPDLDE